jgi:DNA modification methylase
MTGWNLPPGEQFHDGKVVLWRGDCLDLLPTIASESVDAVVTDPPYGIKFMSKEWDKDNIAFRTEVWVECLRCLKPGAHLVAFGGTRTYHRLVCAIEDAGFEIRDQLAWVYGQGLPKTRVNVSKAIDKVMGVESIALREKMYAGGHIQKRIEYLPASDAAKLWSGWYTVLKPAWEPILLARKPLSEGTVAANILHWGTGALNIDGCRIHATDSQLAEKYAIAQNNCERRENSISGTDTRGRAGAMPHANGRWPANLIHDGSDEVLAGFPESVSTGGLTPGVGSKSNPSTYQFGDRLAANAGGLGDSGSAARFFYTAKANSDDRLGSKHPTVKPLDLMQYLVRLITPKGGVVLDPFAGTGTTGEAALREGMKAVLIERESEYQADIVRRMALFGSSQMTRKVESLKTKGKIETDLGPLFGGEAS